MIVNVYHTLTHWKMYSFSSQIDHLIAISDKVEILKLYGFAKYYYKQSVMYNIEDGKCIEKSKELLNKVRERSNEFAVAIEFYEKNVELLNFHIDHLTAKIEQMKPNVVYCDQITQYTELCEHRSMLSFEAGNMQNAMKMLIADSEALALGFAEYQELYHFCGEVFAQFKKHEYVNPKGSFTFKTSEHETVYRGFDEFLDMKQLKQDHTLHSIFVWAKLLEYYTSCELIYNYD